jgi:hypothetical protein
MPSPGDFNNATWKNPTTLRAESFVCGYCGDKVSSEKGYSLVARNNLDHQVGGVFICPNCRGPTYLVPPQKLKFPGNSFGHSVAHVPNSLNTLYQEARDCTAAGCYTAAVLVCRKMLMNIAVEQGAQQNLAFIAYVDYLSAQGFVPPNGKQWVDHIRKKGNEANHEIALMSDSDAKELIIFVEMLLKFIYEFPNLVPKPQT